MTARPAGISLADALHQIEETRVDSIRANLAELGYAGDTRVKIGRERHELTEPAWARFCSYLDIPPNLLPQLGGDVGETVVERLHQVRRRAKGAPERIRFTCRMDGAVVAVSSAHLACASNQEITRAIREALPKRIASETLSVTELNLSETEFELSCCTAQLKAAPRPGDTVWGGITVRHSQAGASPTTVLAYIHRLVCSNGMTQRICLHGHPARTKRPQASHSSELVQEAITRQIEQAWAQLRERLDGLKELIEHRMDGDALPETLRRRWSINRDVALEIAQALQNDELGRTYSEYDLVNALSRVATHTRSLAPRYRRYLSLIAGTLAQRHIHHCPVCGSWLDGPEGTHGSPAGTADPDPSPGSQDGHHHPSGAAEVDTRPDHAKEQT